MQNCEIKDKEVRSGKKDLEIIENKQTYIKKTF